MLFTFQPPTKVLTSYHVVHIVVANAPKYSVDLHYVRMLENLSCTSAALVTQFVGFSHFIFRSPDVPPNAKITYQIELFGFEEEPLFSQLPVTERIQMR